MNRIIFSCLIAFIFVQCGFFEKDKEQANSIVDLPKQPNIIWLVAEDLSPVIPSFGDNTIETPHLTRLANEGVCYDNVFSPSGVCSPSRAAIATGMYPVVIGANQMRTGPWYISPQSPEVIKNYSEAQLPQGINSYEAITPPTVTMMSEYLRRAGYYCTNNAKEDYQFQKTLTAWDESSSTAHWKNRKEGQPFFAIFNYGITHESQIWARQNDSLWVDETIKVNVPPYLPNNEIGQRDVRRMYSNIKFMDNQVGQMLKELEEAGELENTIIVWYTDHGGPLPRQKRLLYDSGLRVPMIIRFPNKQHANTRDNRLVSFIDFAPTALSLAGLEPPKDMNGKAFLGKYKRTEEPKYIFAAADRFDKQYDNNRAVRGKQYKYIRYYETEKPMYLDVAYRKQMPIMQELLRMNEAGELNKTQALWFRNTKPKEELFDTWSDPHEINNLADHPDYQEKLEELREANNKWQEEYQDLGMLSEAELLKKIQPNGQQPIMVKPEIIQKGSKIELTCSTDGASIGYKIITNDEEPTSWQVYTTPFELPIGAKLKVVSDRIGYQPSEIVEL